MKKLSKILRLPYTQKYHLVQSIFYLATIRLLLLFFPLRWIIRLFSITEMKAQEHSNDQSRIQNIRCSIQRATANMPWECTCLVRSLAESILLKKSGIPSTLYLGVAKSKEIEEKFSFHAWVSLPTIEEKCEDFKIISSFTNTRQSS